MLNNYDVVQKIVGKLKALPELFTALVQKVDGNSQSLETALHTDDIANNLTTETSGKVLDASQGYVLKGYTDTLTEKIGKISFIKETVPADGNKDITIGNMKDFLLIILGNSGAMYFGRTISDGTVTLYMVSNSSQATNITITNGTGSINVAWAGSGGLNVILMYI